MKYLTTSVLILIFTLFLMSCKTENFVAPTEKNTSDVIGKTWYIPGDFATIQEAIDNPGVVNGDILQLGDGTFAGVLLNKGVIIIGSTNTVINSGPPRYQFIQGFRLLAGSDNAGFKHLIFTTDLAIMNGEAVSNVEISHCTFLNSVQAISNWAGDNWVIDHNIITDLRCDNGGGIGILIGDRLGGTVSGNVITHNAITGTLHVPTIGEGGGYSGTGIVIYADFRYGWPGSLEMTNNYITHNTISVISDNPGLVDIIACELSDLREIPDPNIIHGNVISYNDFRGSAWQIALTPENLDETNEISRNLGNNRGHGTHPSGLNP